MKHAHDRYVVALAFVVDDVTFSWVSYLILIILINLSVSMGPV